VSFQAAEHLGPAAFEVGILSRQSDLAEPVRAAKNVREPVAG
jgi:hypothetical protein